MTEDAGKERISKLEADLGNDTGDIQLPRGFVVVVRTFEKLSGFQDRAYDAEHSRYSAVSSGRQISELELLLEEFFGPPKKRSDNPFPKKLQNHPILGYLQGDVERQSLFFKKSPDRLFFASLEPLAEPYGAVAVCLGFARKKSSQKPVEDSPLQMEDAAPSGEQHPERQDAAPSGPPGLEMEDIGLPARSMEERIAEELNEKSGRVDRVGLATFLLEAEVDEAAALVRVVCADRKGELYLKDGALIDAVAGELQGKGAAVEILSWTDTEITVEEPTDREENTVGEPLVKILATALKKRKKEKGPAPDERKAAVRSSSGSKGGKRPEKTGAPSNKSGKKQKKKGGRRIRPLHLAAAAVVLILAAGAVFGFQYWKQSQREKAFVEAVSAADARQDPDKALAVLEKFVEAGPDDEFARKAKEQIQKRKKEAEKRLLDQLTAEVEALPKGPGFERSAAKIYRRFLERYPDGLYAKRVEERISSLPETMEAHFYQQVKEIDAKGPEEKMAVYRRYLEMVPKGAHKDEVKEKLESVVADRLRYLDMEVRRCKMDGDPQRCLQLIDDYMASDPTAGSNPTVSQWRRELQARQDLIELEKRTAGLENEPGRLQRVLEDFLAQQPAAPAAEEASARLAALERRSAEQLRWEKAQQTARDGNQPVAERIEAVQTYISQTDNDTYRRAARALKDELEREYSRQVQQRRAKEAERIRQERLKQQREQAAQEQLRLAHLFRQVETKLPAAGGRFVSRGNGTFTDTRTGLLWTLLDSRAVLERCHDYATARQYVSNLTTGSFRDWRLPTAAELAGLYKNRPFFPDGDVPWYWTSRSFVTGYHEKVRVVRPDRKGELQPEYRRSNECGAVRAVRNPR